MQWFEIICLGALETTLNQLLTLSYTHIFILSISPLADGTASLLMRSHDFGKFFMLFFGLDGKSSNWGRFGGAAECRVRAATVSATNVKS
jgi:hypothetical protein